MRPSPERERERRSATQTCSTNLIAAPNTENTSTDSQKSVEVGASDSSTAEKLTYEDIFYRPRKSPKGGLPDLRIPDGQGQLVHERPQATGFATRWTPYCTGELKISPQSTGFQSQFAKGTGAQPSSSEFSDSTLVQGADINIVQYLGIAADEPERIARHTKPGYLLPLVEIGWDEAYCRQWCEENDLLSPIYTDSARGGCWFCHNQGLDQLRLLRKNYPDLWKILLKWDKDSPVSFKPDGHTVHDYDRRFRLEDEGKVPKDRKFRWKMLEQEGDDIPLMVYDCEVFA